MGQSETKPVSAEALMDLLPNEAILEVMKHLPISDLKLNIARVSKRFLKISKDKLLRQSCMDGICKSGNIDRNEALAFSEIYNVDFHKMKFMKDKVEAELERKRVFDSLFSKLGKIKQPYINLVHGIKIEELSRALTEEKDIELFKNNFGCHYLTVAYCKARFKEDQKLLLELMHKVKPRDQLELMGVITPLMRDVENPNIEVRVKAIQTFVVFFHALSAVVIKLGLIPKLMALFTTKQPAALKGAVATLMAKFSGSATQEFLDQKGLEKLKICIEERLDASVESDKGYAEIVFNCHEAVLHDEQNWPKYAAFFQKSLARDAFCVYTSWDAVYIEYLQGEPTESTVRQSASQVRGPSEHAAKNHKHVFEAMLAKFDHPENELIMPAKKTFAKMMSMFDSTHMSSLRPLLRGELTRDIFLQVVDMLGQAVTKGKTHEIVDDRAWLIQTGVVDANELVNVCALLAEARATFNDKQCAFWFNWLLEKINTGDVKQRSFNVDPNLMFYEQEVAFGNHSPFDGRIMTHAYITSGKWYYEVKVLGAPNKVTVGWANIELTPPVTYSMTCPVKETDHEIVIGCFIDMEKREITYAFDGVKQEQKYQMDIINVKYAPYIRLGPAGECQVNFGRDSFVNPQPDFRAFNQNVITFEKLLFKKIESIAEDMQQLRADLEASLEDVEQRLASKISRVSDRVSDLSHRVDNIPRQ